MGQWRRALTSVVVALVAVATSVALASQDASAAPAAGGMQVTALTPGVSVAWVSAGAAETMPAGWRAPNGILSYTLNLDPSVLAPGSTVTVQISGLSVIPQSLVQVDPAGHLIDLTQQMTVPTGQTAAPYSIDLDLTDGGLGDEDGVANDQIVDPVQPLTPASGLQVTTTGLSVSSSAAYQPVVVTATIAPPTGTNCPGGTVTFTDVLYGTPLTTTALGTITLNPDTCSASATNSTLGAGFHIVTGVYTPPSNCTGSPYCGFTGSLGSVPYVLTPAPACGPTGPSCPDPQGISADVPAGSLALSTPYTPANPLVLSLTLNATGTALTGEQPFGSTTGTAADPLANTIEIIDTRTGGLNWAVSALASNLYNSGATAGINAQNIGLLDLVADTVPGNHLSAANTQVHNAAPPPQPVGIADPGSLGLGGATAHTVAASTDTTLGGVGTIGFTGTLEVTAPTSTPAGHYTGTITFTVA